ncbi:hypothetical protein [Bacillus pseudomycoides]|uniref:hypothetical protein n=1 Tax=Bacillus pseudomycoides TaxID=64104 RepID=UPI000BEC6ADD|nr:hypothetical protein [Bacillus pseudomycoides]PEE07124.1 hypothetical protein CON86_04840 [Bacillus pseudomycoides]PEM77865.1 hypothetical protein CN632_07945 [Bacillus pseudomycoides]PHC83732.1 hypothetical protein COF63_17860 [Bacillus pseudomycoides]
MKGELTAEQKAWFKQLAEHELEEARLMQSGLPYRDVKAIEDGRPTGNPSGAHDSAPEPPGDFPNFIPDIGW